MSGMLGIDEKLVVADPAMRQLHDLVGRLAPSNRPVLIVGETGCGKELVANELHRRSYRAQQRLVSINCAAIHASLVESELFGHEKGSFTNAIATRDGFLQAASGSTLFLDEIGELALSTQAKLLRVVETGRIIRVGDTREREIDVRIVAATNRDLEAEVAAGRFRRDLYFRISAATLRLPPLRDRHAELEQLAARFLDEACARSGRRHKQLSSCAFTVLRSHHWPGNIRELKNLMSYAAATIEAETVVASHLVELLQAGRVGDSEATPMLTALSDSARHVATDSFRPLADEIRDLEITRMRQALKLTEGNQSAAARLLSIAPTTLWKKVRDYGLVAYASKRRTSYAPAEPNLRVKARLREYIRQNPHCTIDRINAGLRTLRRDILTPLLELLASGEIGAEGAVMRTRRYFPIEGRRDNSDTAGP